MISGELLQQVLEVVGQEAALSDELLGRALRTQFSGVHFSLCSDDDMPSRVPFAAENSVCRLYYVSSRDHCLSLSNDADAATGLAVARLSADD